MKLNYVLVLLMVFLGKMTAQEVYIPDDMFRYKLLHANSNNQTAKNLLGVWTEVDTNHNGIIEADEAAYIFELDLEWIECCYYIQDLEGIKAFTNLEILDVSNNRLTSLDVSGLVHMWTINCRGNMMTSINVEGLTGMQHLDCSSNLLTSLDLSNLTTISFIACQFNQLTTLNLSGTTAMAGVRCYNNQLTSLDLSDCPDTNIVECENNLLTSLDLTPCPLIQTVHCENNLMASIAFPNSHPLNELRCSNNLLTSLDLSGSTGLASLVCANNQLTVIDLMNQQLGGVITLDNNPPLQAILVKNGLVNNNGFTFSNCPNLRYLCIDDNEEAMINTKITQYGLTGQVHLNNYCSFTPGGEFFTVEGNNRVDMNNNGCDSQDVSVPNLKFNITGLATGSVISNSNGNYSIPLQAGLHTITPVLENPDYFNITPASVQVSLPGQGSPFTQNFCIGVVNPRPDLEVMVLPVGPARPGFDAHYKVHYRNKGNTLQDFGTVSVMFEDEVMDFVSATGDAVQSGNVLTWHFTDLDPFESGSFNFIMNINSPMENPPVEGGTVLHFTASVASEVVDTTPDDNAFAMRQTVVNSLDPNDKTCLEGKFATPDIAGKFVHYVIRFENTGTFAAENIVVRDIIDTNQFDVTSLVSLTGSSPFVTRISGNKVEFIFENINLPFDDANNDGYVAFKIKTRPTLGIGDSFTNSAAIYFDYNFPIITNDATTTIRVLGKEDFVFSDYFSIYPNPTSATLSIHNTKNIGLESASIYNTLGQLLLIVPERNGLDAIDVSMLPAGQYFLKLYSDEGVAATTFLKK